MDKEKKPYLTYRPFYAANGLMVKPGVVVRCTEIEAMCINTMQAMTLRKMKEKDYEPVQGY
jgi:hypothetical protein